MSKLIAMKLVPVPSEIFRLFRAVIDARTAMHNAFQHIVNQRPDPEIEASNMTHRHFIDALTDAFDTLGGKHWDGSSVPPVLGQDIHDERTFRNIFSALDLGEVDGEEADGSCADSSSRSPIQQNKRRETQVKVERERGGKGAKRQSASESITQSSSTDVPVESYRIIEAGKGFVSEHLLAVYAVVQEWMDLRISTQDPWREVAYEGLNGAIAASLTSMAVAMVKQTCVAVFADFPDHESYETIIQTVTRGAPDKASKQFGLSVYRMTHCYYRTEQAEEKFWTPRNNSGFTPSKT